MVSSHSRRKSASFSNSSRGVHRPWLMWLLLSAIIIVLDQLTKFMIFGDFEKGESRTVSTFFNVVRVHNPGAAFSMLAEAGGWQRWFFVGIAVLACAFLLTMLFKHGSQRLFSLALALILGGAIGNLIDRLIHGYVIDFLDFHWEFLAGVFPGGHFPAFNVADAAISVGAVLLIVDELRRVMQRR